MNQKAIIKYLMKLRESEIKFNPEEGAVFREVFDHPYYLSLDETAQIELGLRWARKLYQTEAECSSFDSYFGDFDLPENFKNPVMLDVGCYIGGKTVSWLERYHGIEIHGIDIDPRFIRIATCFAKEKNANAHFKVSFAEELDYPDSFFDVILSENTFEHVYNIRKVMRECNRVLKKEGFMVITFPPFWGPSNHHLYLVTRTPFIHWFFQYSSLLETYFAILNERGADALWYRRLDEHPLPFEKGYSINGLGALVFRKLLKDNWNIIADGYTRRTSGKGFVKDTWMNFLKITPLFRELFPVAYVVQKR